MSAASTGTMRNGAGALRAASLSIVIPAYNEEARLEPTLRQIAEYIARVNRTAEMVVVDDGSRDGTATLVRRLARDLPGLRLIRLAANRGKGHAVRSGVLNAVGDLVLIADADGATPIEEVERLERAILEGSDIAIGSRALVNAATRVNTRFYRKVIGRAFHTLVRVLTVSGFEDTQCGFKLFRAAAAHDLFSRMRMDGFVFDVEVLLMAQVHGYSVREVAVNWTHQPGSKVNLVKDSLRMARDLFIIRANQVRGRYTEPHVRVETGEPAERAVGNSTALLSV